MILESSSCAWDTGGPQQNCDANSGLMTVADRNCDGWTMFRYMSLGTPTTGPLATITVTPNPASTTTGGQVTFSATGTDANGNAVSFTPSWTETGDGTITNAGVYTAGQTAGSFTVTASSGSIQGSATVNVSAPQTPVLTTIVVTPNPASTTTGGQVAFSAQGKDQNGAPMAATFTWSASGGTVDQAGNYTAGATAGNFTVTATSGSVSGSASVAVSAPSGGGGGSPTIVDNDTAGFSILSGTWSIHFTTYYFGANCRLLASSGGGSCKWAAPLAAGTYDVFAWWPARGDGTSATPSYTVHTASGDVSVAVDQTNSATWGKWNKLGTYSLDATASVTIVAAANTSPAADAIQFAPTGGSTPPPPVLTTIAVSPNPANLAAGAPQTFTAQGADQNGQPMSTTFTWSATGGTIDQSGNYTAGPTAGTFSVTATSGNVSGSATVTITSTPPNQVLTTIVVSPNPASTTTGGTVAFSAQAKDQNGSPMEATFTWGTSAGTIDQTGHYTAPNGTGSFDVSASSQGIVGHATVNVSAPMTTLIVDDSDPAWSVVSGTWNKHFNTYYFGSGDHLIATGTAGVCQWKPALASGTYDVYVWTPALAAPANAVFTITTASGDVPVSFDQTNQAAWNTFTKIGTWSLASGTAVLKLTANAGQNVAADAVKFVQTGP
jgi:hypothetical protein